MRPRLRRLNDDFRLILTFNDLCLVFQLRMFGLMPEPIGVTATSELVPPCTVVIDPNAMMVMPDATFILPGIVLLDFTDLAPMTLRMPKFRMFVIVVPMLVRIALNDTNVMMDLKIAIDSINWRATKWKWARRNADDRRRPVMMMFRPCMVMHNCWWRRWR